MASLQLAFLGQVSVTIDKETALHFPMKSVPALLAYLAEHGPKQRHERGMLAELLWPGMAPKYGRKNLRQTLYELNKLLPEVDGEPLITAARQYLQWNSHAAVEIDTQRFEQALQDPSRENLKEALTYYQGDFLAEFYLPGSTDFENWAQNRRVYYRRRYHQALHTLITLDPGDTADYARRLLASNPLDEDAARRLMTALAEQGERAAALKLFERLQEQLQDEVKMEPSRETEALAVSIRARERLPAAMLQGEEPEAPQPLPAAVLLEQTAQFDSRTVEQRGEGYGFPPHNLPPQLTPFVGREAELTRLRELLARPDVHLVTILGIGGSGKTRLALALAEQIWSKQSGSRRHPYQHGVYFASLARLETADFLLAAIAEAVHFSFRDGQDQQDQLLRYLAQKSMLLVLDNFEHLLAGAALIDEILERAPQIKIVITSRTRVNRQSEQLFPIRGMAYPSWKGAAGKDDRDDLHQYSAVQLFLQCARRVQPDFTLTAANQDYVLQICQLLQGMPLGIVLAASWLHALSPRAISGMLEQDIDFLATDMEDVPRRQRSLRAAFNHSWRLLSQREQEIFCQMSIFRGGFSRAAAQAITGATPRDLQALVNKSLLLLAPDRRYEVHELLRQFAAEKLGEREELETAVRERHSIYYCTLLQQHTPNWHNAQQQDTLSKVTLEASNIQIAWDWALQHEAWPRLLEAIDSWGAYHQWRGLRENGERFCQALCTNLEQWAATNPADGAARYLLWAKAMIWYGHFASAIRVATQRIEQSLTLLEQPELAAVDTRPVEVFALNSLGGWLINYKRQEARSYLERSLLLQEALQVSWGTAASLRGLGLLDWNGGDYASASQRLEMSLAICQELGDQWDEIGVVNHLALLYLHLGRLEKSEELYQRALDLSRQLNDRSSFAQQVANMAAIVMWQGKFEEGQQWAEKSIIASQEDGYLDAEGLAQLVSGWSLLLAGQYKRARQALARSLVIVRTVNNRAFEATIHSVLADVALVLGEHDQAHTELEQSLRLYQALQGDAYTFRALSGLGLITCHRGQLEQARRHLVELLTGGLKRKDFLWISTALPVMSLYRLKWGDKEEALTIWAQALAYPHIANAQFYEDVVGQEIKRATADLPAQIIEAAQANGRSQDMWRMAESFLLELQSGQ